jgi:hypothetical protein
MSQRDEARRLVRELLDEILQPNGNGNGHVTVHEGAPPVPAPPVPAVLRPSTWTQPPVPGEIVGDGSAAPAAASEPVVAADGAERVTIDSDADLDSFVRSLLARFENPRDRMALRSGQLRFTLRRRSTGEQGGAEVMRIEKGAVTERTVKDAARAGARLMLAPRAVLTPLARETARALGVEIERERRC